MNPLLSDPTRYTYLFTLIRRYISGTGNLHNIFDKPHPANLGMRPVTITHDDPYGWLLLDFERLARTIRDIEYVQARQSPEAARMALELNLDKADPRELAEALQELLTDLLPPCRYFRPQGRQVAWDACMAALGRKPHEELLMGLYRCPYILTKSGLHRGRIDELRGFFRTCWNLDTPQLACFPGPLSVVLRACGSAWRDRARYHHTPVDAFGLSWTGTHLLFWQPDMQLGFDDFEYELSSGNVVLRTKDVLDRLDGEQGELDRAMGADNPTKELWGLRLAAIPELQTLMDEILRMPSAYAPKRVKKLQPQKRSKAVRAPKGLVKVHGFELNAAELDLRAKTPHLTMLLDCFWRKNAMYLRFPGNAQGLGFAGAVDEKFVQMSRSTPVGGVIRVDLRKAAGDPITHEAVTLKVGVDEDKAQETHVFVHPEGVFVRADGFAQGAPYREYLVSLYKNYRQDMSPEARTYLAAFIWFTKWLNEGAEMDFAEAARRQGSVPAWAQAMVNPVFPGAPVFDTLEKRGEFFKTIITNRVTRPMLAFHPNDTGRAPFKTLTDEWLIAYGRWHFSRMAHFCGYTLHDKQMREVISYILMPWTRPSGLMKSNVSMFRHMEDVVTAPPKTTPDMAELCRELYEMSGSDLPWWCVNPSNILANSIHLAS